MLRARWQVQLIVAVLLAVAGAFMLIDPGRAELVAGPAMVCDLPPRGDQLRCGPDGE